MSLFKGVNKYEITGITDFIVNITKLALELIDIVCIIFIIIGGIIYITSAGNEERMQKGKATLTWAIIGFIIVTAARLLLEYFKSSIIK